MEISNPSNDVEGKSEEKLAISPVCHADELGLQYTQSVSAEHKKNFGQFFTPVEIARYLAGFVAVKGKKIRILDPGCGTGILACAVAEIIISKFPKITEIELTAFETDIHLIPFAEKAFAYLRQWLAKKNISFNHFLCANDFILHNTTLLTNESDIHERFHLVIANPPYFKIPKEDPRAVAAKSIIHGQTNIYSIFLIVSAKLLEANGQLIFITPRSFASGNYFKLFREIFFSLVKLEHIHLFGSRRNAFLRDSVLQENIIIYARRRHIIKDGKIAATDKKNVVKISTSNGINDIQARFEKKFVFNDLVNMNTPQKILHLPTSPMDEKAIKIFKSWRGTLDSYGIEISTGPVVDFRSTEFITAVSTPNSVPLIWLNNVKAMEFEWPVLQKPKGKDKGQFITQNNESRSRLIKNRNYVFLRRFSAKDDHSRLIASHYFSNWFPDFSHIGVENHLNYIYRKSGVLSRVQALGIASVLNSKLFDIYFRTFNGNINVSATELREMPFPPLKQIEAIGTFVGKNSISKRAIDFVVESIFKINLNNEYSGSN